MWPVATVSVARQCATMPRAGGPGQRCTPVCNNAPFNAPVCYPFGEVT